MLRVAKVDGEAVRRLLIQLSLVDTEQAITRDERFVRFPLIREPYPKEWSLIRELDFDSTVEILEPSTPKRERRPNNLIEALRGSVEPTLLEQVEHSFDIIGNIAIIEVPEELAFLKKPIGEAIIKIHKNVKTVLCKSSAVDGRFRVRGYELVVGEEKTETIHVEHGCRFMLDVTKVYFSPRLATEHLRVASQASSGELVIDMFCGVGPFSILIAKLKGSQVYSIDVNPDAIKYLKTNCILNKVDDFVHPMLGDAGKLISASLKSTADRIIMNLPSESLKFIDVACSALKPEGGVIHSYQFQTDPGPLKKAVEALRVNIGLSNRKMQRVLEARLVKSVAPHEWHVAVDAAVN
jgi:tRNA (guanine37-N1)-methyltransferase